MIDCPICHVKNNDDARFCAECGQRLTVQGGAPSLAEPTQSLGQWGQPAPQPGPQAAPPPAAPLPAPQDQGGGGRPKLKSPLLSGDEDYGSGGPGASQQYGGGGPDDMGANRLRQMSQNPPKHVDPAIDPNRQYKNPYDPRNANPPENPPESGPPQGGRKLRSPLLSAEEFDDSDFAEQDPPPANVRGGGLRSPLLGGSEGGGGGGLRSPMLGGGRQGSYDDMDDEPQSGGAGRMRSPLLGGGGGDYGGPERRRTEDASYGGQDRRKGGLRSPILGGAGGGDYYDDYDEEEPIDEDDPTVLRSPLLAARRPHNERPRKEQTPPNSNTMNPPPPGQMPEISRNLPNPSNSYTSLRSVRNAAPQPGAPAPSSIPPVPSEPGPQGYPQQYQQPHAQHQQPQPQPGFPTGYPPHQQPYGGQPQQQMPGMQPAAQPPAAPQPAPQPGSQGQPPGPPTNVPPSFSSVYTERRPSPEPSAPVPTAQPVRPDEVSKFNKATERGTESGINVQAPISGTQPVISEKPAMDEHSRNMTRRRSGLLAGGGYEDDEEAGGGYSPQFSHHAAPSGPPSPIPKIIGVIAMIMFLAKAFSFVTGFLASDWKQFTWLTIDQVSMCVIFLCVAVLAFTRKD